LDYKKVHLGYLAIAAFDLSTGRAYLISMAELKREYIPGVCNIGAAEIALRWRFGWAGLAVTVLLWAAFAVFRVAAPWRLFLFLPAGMGATGFLQAALHFCAAFGLRGVFNFRPEAGKTDTVMRAEFRKKDRAKAFRIAGYSTLIGVTVALIGYLTA
jgi:hypothetical protein